MSRERNIGIATQGLAVAKPTGSREMMEKSFETDLITEQEVRDNGVLHEMMKDITNMPGYDIWSHTPNPTGDQYVRGHPYPISPEGTGGLTAFA
ncbi:hypothetical protein ACJ73_05428 [Blastomyces percursus]|uniref:Uncharacterized protein n=1 Tax=Blastomyces percursus TaxID=1658174 RepID=A0A1J9Q535_9EURO|nr:hypothetical protein ACJ73_05428 [Blastomyces percursus]